MSSRIRLPALKGNIALGFLGALGTQVLCAHVFGDDDCRVGWPSGPSQGAEIVTSVAADAQGLAARLTDIAASLRPPCLFPVAANFPPDAVGAGAGTDPVRQISFDSGREYAFRALEDPSFEPWLCAVLALDEPIVGNKREGSLSVTPMAARGPGTVMLARTLAKLAVAAGRPEKLEEALTFWMREDSIAGYLDHLAMRDASYHASKTTKQNPDNYGVPAAAWLAMMSMPMFPSQTRHNDVAIAPGWPRVARRRTIFRWPVWAALLHVDAVRAVLGHPDVARASLPAGDTELDSSLQALGVFAVFESERIEAGNNDGPLGPSMRLWPARHH